MADPSVSYRERLARPTFLKHDARLERACLVGLARWLSERDSITSIVDVMGGIGESAGVWEQELSPETMLLNDLDEHCCKQLVGRYPDATVSNRDAKAWDWPPADLVFIDFNCFTLRQVDEWAVVFERLARTARWGLVTDSCCYGFKFGARASWRRYADSEAGYWALLERTFWNRFGLGLRAASRFSNAAFLLFDHLAPGVEWIKPIEDRKGFF